ncbi:hypothetical protein AGMMS49982_16430 [Bacteroidia bacterium]|nr:hypothetical protein AGMMS49982_16430 [Bacteroidia bacterium]
MKTTAIKDFHTVEFFRAIKEKMAEATEGMSLQEERAFWKKMRDGEIKLA